MAIIFSNGPKNTRMAPKCEQQSILHALGNVWEWYTLQFTQVYSHNIPFPPNDIGMFVEELGRFLCNGDGDVMVLGDIHNGAAYTAYNAWQQQNVLYQDRYIRFVIMFNTRANRSQYCLLYPNQVYHFNIEPSISL
jgi:hypothetical protein